MLERRILERLRGDSSAVSRGPGVALSLIWFDPGGSRTVLASRQLELPSGQPDFMSQMSEELVVVAPGLKWPRVLTVLQ